MIPATIGVEPRPDGRNSGVFFADDAGLSNRLRGGVKLLSSRSLRLETGVNIAGAELTGVKPPAFTAVNPDDVTGCDGGIVVAGGVGVAAGESRRGIFFRPFS